MEDTRYTSIYKSLWNRDFIALEIADFLLTLAVYMQFPWISYQLLENKLISKSDAAIATLFFSLGLYVLGPICGWLSQMYRRNRVYIYSTVCMIIAFIFIDNFYNTEYNNHSDSLRVFWIAFLLFGAFYGVSKRLITGTLMIDKSESYNRSKVNNIASFFTLFSIIMGFIISSILIWDQKILDLSIIVYTILAISILLVVIIKFPFKTPDENAKVLSFDRFFLLKGCNIFLILLLLAFIFGYLISHNNSMLFYKYLLIGFSAIIPINLITLNRIYDHIYLFNGLILFLISLFLIFNYNETIKYHFWYVIIFGGAFCNLCTILLHILLNSNAHCHRCTSISTYFLAIESGLVFGVSFNYVFQ